MLELDALFFDLDDTLLDDAACWRRAVELTSVAVSRVHPGVSAHGVGVTYREHSDRLWASFGDAPSTIDGARTVRDLRMTVWASALGTFGITDESVIARTVDVYERHRQESYSCFPDVDVLRRLRSHLSLGVITNGPSDGQREKLAVADLAGVFDVVVVSNDLGIGKPDPAIFRYALDQLGVVPERAAHVGDNLHKDVVGARATGMTAIWLNRGGVVRGEADPVPDHEITTLSELLALLSLRVVVQRSSDG